MRPDGNDKPIETVYTRKDGVYLVSMNGSEAVPTDHYYNPTEDRWLETIFGTSIDLEWSYYKSTTRTRTPGITWKKKVSTAVTAEGRAEITRSLPVGTYLRDNSDFLKEYPELAGDATLYGRYQREVGDVEVLESTSGKKDYRVLGFGKVTEWASDRSTQNMEETYTTWLNASRPIEIEFTGNETVGTINISSGKSITLGDLVRSSHDLTINAGGDILAGEKALVRNCCSWTASILYSRPSSVVCGVLLGFSFAAHQGEYDPNYVFKYSDKVWEDLRASALSAEQIRAEEQKFLAEEQKRTDAYHNAILSDYQGDYVYTATQAEVSLIFTL